MEMQFIYCETILGQFYWIVCCCLVFSQLVDVSSLPPSMAHVDPMVPIDPPPLPQRPESSHRRNASRLSTHEDAGDDLDALIAINQELADMGLDRDRFGSRSMMMYRSNTLLNRDQFARRLASQSVSNSVSMAARASSPSLPAASERENVASVPSVFASLRSHSAQPSVEDSLPLPHFKLDEPSGADVGMAQCVLFGRIQNIELSHAFSVCNIFRLPSFLG
jgi:hypothetical protein